MKPATDSNVDPLEVQKFDALASRWWDPDGEFKPLHRLNPVRLGYLEQRVGLTGKSCLDVGCGGGLLSEGLAEHGAAHVTGIDMAEKPLTVAKLHQQKSGLGNIEYQQGSAEELAARQPGAFDMVCCMEVVEHVPDPVSLLSACRTLAKPGGDVVFSTLNRNLKAFMLAIVGAEYVLRMLPKGTHEYAKFIKPSELRRWGRDCGLEFADLTGLTYNPLNGTFSLGADVDVNYLMHFRNPA